MRKTRFQLPDTTALEQQFDAVLRGSYANFLSSTHVRRQAVIGNRRYALVAAAFSAAVLIFLFFIRDGYGTFIWNVFIICAILWLLAVLIFARRWLTDTKLLAKEVNMALAPLITNTLNLTTVYTSDIHHREETLQLLKDSALMTEFGTKVVSDDMFTIYGDSELSMRELLITKDQPQQKGQTQTIELFRGVLIVAKLPFTHNAETYISTENDRQGFAHRNFWTDILGRAAVTETQLEWNDFEKDLHVASSSGSAAREILTPDFMHDLHEWWLEHKLNIRIAFKQNMLYMLLPETTVKFGTSTTSAKPDDIRRYASSLIRPLWRSLLLIEDVVGREDMI